MSTGIIHSSFADLKNSTDKDELAKLSWLARANSTTPMNEQGVLHIYYTIMIQRIGREE